MATTASCRAYLVRPLALGCNGNMGPIHVTGQAVLQNNNIRLTQEFGLSYLVSILGISSVLVAI